MVIQVKDKKLTSKDALVVWKKKNEGKWIKSKSIQYNNFDIPVLHLEYSWDNGKHYFKKYIY